MMMVIGIVVLAVLVGLVIYGVGIYNSLVQVKNNTEKAWKNIDVLLLQRHDELPKLVDTVKGYQKHEQGLLEKLTQLRMGYQQAPGIDEKTKIENELNRDLGRLRMVWEGYPDLKASSNFLKLSERISGLESSIADRREFFNDSVNIYNIQIETFPAMLLAKPLGYQRKALLEVPEEMKQDVKVHLS